ncbi:MAG: clostripain-related cysteine peptidase [Thermoplasmata archaeon]|nr:clostripain-related cysteine peptidase [Thermoplasmata archaeon]
MRNLLSRLAVVLVFAALIAVPSFSTEATDVDEKTSDAETAVKDWTVLMYWDADNSLEFCTEFAMQTWQEAMVSDEHVNLVAFVDILSVNGTWVYTFSGNVTTMVAEWPEKNCSDAAVLKEFVDFALDEYPAEKTMLVMQDHGYSWRGLCVDDTDGGGIMLIDDLHTALLEIREERGRPIDILAMDACSMSTLEVAYELRDAVSYFTASQVVVPFDGLPYEMIVDSLMADETVSPEALATSMVDMYMEYYSSKTLYEHIYPYDQDFVALTSFDQSKIGAAGESFMALTAVLEPMVDEFHKEIKAARDVANTGIWANIGGWEYLADVCTLFDELKGLDPELDAAIDDFNAKFDAALLNEGNSDVLGDLPQGAVINFPPILALYDSVSWWWAKQFVYHDLGLDLVDGSRWYQCLMEYYAAEPGLQSRPNL